MAAKELPIKQKIDTSEFDGVTLDTLKSALGNAKPELIESAAGEFRTAMANLKTLIESLDRHLKAFDEHWTAGEDAKVVKAQLRRIRESAQNVVDTVVVPNPPGKMGPFAPQGIAPAMEMYSTTLRAFRGDHIPDKADKDVSFLEGAFQGGMAGAGAGAGVGFFVGGVGAVPGAVIGAVGGTVIGGVTSLFTDGPFQNMFGDSKTEQDLKAAKEHLKKLTAATAQVNEAFPVSVKTDIPEFTPPDPTIPPVPPTGDKYGPNGTGSYPPGGGQPYVPAFTMNGLPPGSGPGGLDGGPGVPGGDLPGGGLPGGGLPGWNGPDGNGPGQNGPGWDDPTGNGPGQNGPGWNGPGADGGYPGGPGTGGTGGNGTHPGGDPGQDTKLAGYNAQLNDLAGQQGQLGDAGRQNLLGGTGQQGSSGNGSANTVTGVGSFPPGGTGGHGAGGAGADARGMSGARALGAGTGSTVPVVPHGASKADEDSEERSRSTWMLEDEDLFMSDKPVTSPFINGASKGKT
ncbi:MULTISPECIES: WXG100 family type VII secretion target [Streptosporangium]|uniref:WXG100 family type VII secretion target n=1 Tax=Streptosporangium brasiliense TaxID=47480 RepID=A0ABT9R887_9ACTN|nr:hypothetical protein [Streptosporangium brasiliense]MDP9865453.1 hypothetical protein [Streptosporangium brasiliense]